MTVPQQAGPDWVHHAIWWHVYPLGFTGAFPADSPPGPAEHRLGRIVDWLDHAVSLGASGVALGPVFASATHGYDTVDHYRIDPRLGDDADFDRLIGEAHRRGLRVLLDGVFNHVGTYVGAIAIAGSIQYIPASPSAEQIKAVTQAAARISRKLGYA
jgi:hypothetical protein